eukprot:scaffold8471_cov91-Phaeocystis_antarctica.AAC.3
MAEIRLVVTLPRQPRGREVGRLGVERPDERDAAAAQGAGSYGGPCAPNEAPHTLGPAHHPIVSADSALVHVRRVLAATLGKYRLGREWPSNVPSRYPVTTLGAARPPVSV